MGTISDSPSHFGFGRKGFTYSINPRIDTVIFGRIGQNSWSVFFNLYHCIKCMLSSSSTSQNPVLIHLNHEDHPCLQTYIAHYFSHGAKPIQSQILR